VTEHRVPEHRVPEHQAMEHWDVVIAGGGPAGSAAALRILQRDPASKVLILDRSGFPRDKVCGDGIAGQVFSALAELGIAGTDVSHGYGVVPRVRLVSPGGRTVERTVAGAGYVIPRLVFDARLLAAATARGAVLRQHTVRKVQQSQGRVVLDGAISCQVLIGADGAESTVRRSVGTRPPRVGSVAVAIRGYAAELTGLGGAQVISMSEHRWPAYAWSFPVGDGMANVGYGEVLTGAGVSRSTLLDRLHSILPGLPSFDVRGHRLPLSTDVPPVAAGRVLLVGDALSLINPLSGEGIYYAVRSGMAAGDAAASGAGAGALYRSLIAQRLGRHLRHTRVLARLARLPQLLDAGVDGARRQQGAFDDLVALALGDGLITSRLLLSLRW